MHRYHYTHQLDGSDPDSPERVDIIRHACEIGQVQGPAFVSIYDDSDERVTFLADQIDDIIDALKHCKKYREGIEHGERVAATDAEREA